MLSRMARPESFRQLPSFWEWERRSREASKSNSSLPRMAARSVYNQALLPMIDPNFQTMGNILAYIVGHSLQTSSSVQSYKSLARDLDPELDNGAGIAHGAA